MAEITVMREHDARTVDWSAALWAGVAGGLASVLVRLSIALLQGQSPWGPVRMMAAPLLGKDVLPPPGTFDPGIFLAGMFDHFGISILFALVMALVIRNLSTGVAIFVAMALSLVLYGIVFYLMTPVFPWFAEGRGWIAILMHLILAVVAAWTYRALADRAG